MVELKNFLLKRELLLQIFLSEDQTSILRRIEYDPCLNKMVGFVAPLEANGFPQKNCFIENNLKDIMNSFSDGNEESFAKNAYVFMAQPLVDKAPAFLLGIFGTQNKFSNLDTINRWKYIITKAAEIGITVKGIASDGDPRCMKAMKMFSNFPIKDAMSFYRPYFVISLLFLSF